MNPIDESNDFQWIDETLQGRIRSFSSLIEKYQDRIFTLVIKSIRHQEDAKDITQNVFLNAYSNLKKFRKQSSFQTWLYRIAINQVKNYWRNNKNRFVITESELRQLTEAYGNRLREMADAEKETAPEESKLIVNELISFLPLEQRQMFVFYYVAGYTCQEIADVFKTSASNVKIQLFRGRQYLYNRFRHIFK